MNYYGESILLKHYTRGAHVSVDWIKIGVGGQNCNRE